MKYTEQTDKNDKSKHKLNKYFKTVINSARKLNSNSLPLLRAVVTE